MSIVMFLRCNGEGCDTILPVDAQDVMSARIEARNKGWDATRHFDLDKPDTHTTTDECPEHKNPRHSNVPADLTNRVPRHLCVRGDKCPADTEWVKEQGAGAVFDWCGHDNLGHRMGTQLVRAGYTTVEKVTTAQEGDVLDVRNFGRMCFERWQAFRKADTDA